MAEGYRVFWTVDGYAIERPDGRIVRGRFGSRDQAETRADAIAREAKLKHRACMTCGRRFESEGAHNRMCDNCRSRSAESPYEIGHRRARIGVRA